MLTCCDVGSKRIWNVIRTLNRSISRLLTLSHLHLNAYTNAGPMDDTQQIKGANVVSRTPNSNAGMSTPFLCIITDTHTCRHETCTHIYAYIHIHIHTYIHTYIHTGQAGPTASLDHCEISANGQCGVRVKHVHAHCNMAHCRCVRDYYYYYVTITYNLIIMTVMCGLEVAPCILQSGVWQVCAQFQSYHYHLWSENDQGGVALSSSMKTAVWSLTFARYV